MQGKRKLDRGDFVQGNTDGFPGFCRSVPAPLQFFDHVMRSLNDLPCLTHAPLHSAIAHQQNIRILQYFQAIADFAPIRSETNVPVEHGASSFVIPDFSVFHCDASVARVKC